jgi:hypothetical protein
VHNGAWSHRQKSARRCQRALHRTCGGDLRDSKLIAGVTRQGISRHQLLGDLQRKGPIGSAPDDTRYRQVHHARMWAECWSWSVQAPQSWLCVCRWASHSAESSLIHCSASASLPKFGTCAVLPLSHVTCTYQPSPLLIEWELNRTADGPRVMSAIWRYGRTPASQTRHFVLQSPGSCLWREPHSQCGLTRRRQVTQQEQGNNRESRRNPERCAQIGPGIDIMFPHTCHSFRLQ